MGMVLRKDHRVSYSPERAANASEPYTENLTFDLSQKSPFVHQLPAQIREQAAANFQGSRNAAATLKVLESEAQVTYDQSELNKP